MSDWQVGDAALCVHAKPCAVFGPVDLVEGRTYIVRAVAVGACKKTGLQGTGLKLVDDDCPYWHSAVRFQKAPRHEADEFDRETIALMNRVEQPA